MSSFASKTNLAALKTEVDKIDKDVVKKSDHNTKVTSIEAQSAGLTKNTVDNLADITKL